MRAKTPLRPPSHTRTLRPALKCTAGGWPRPTHVTITVIPLTALSMDQQHGKDMFREGGPRVQEGPPPPPRAAETDRREGLAPGAGAGCSRRARPEPRHSREFHGREVATRLGNRAVCPPDTGAPERTTGVQRPCVRGCRAPHAAATCPRSPRPGRPSAHLCRPSPGGRRLVSQEVPGTRGVRNSKDQKELRLRRHADVQQITDISSR